MDVSVIIVNWNVKDYLRECLRSIQEQSSGVQHEIIVVDNASSDRSAEMLKGEFPHVRLIQNAENKGFAAANNQGIAAARGRYYLILNPDTVILENAIGKLVRFADEHPGAGAVGCAILREDGTVTKGCSAYPSLRALFFDAFLLSKISPKSANGFMTWWGHDAPRRVDVIPGCCMLVRREAVQAAGAIDEAFFMYSEEVDWCYRMSRAGWEIWFTPDARIVHYGKKSSSQMAGGTAGHMAKGRILYFKKHKSAAAYAAVRLVVAAHYLLRLPYWLVVAAVSPGRRERAVWICRSYAGGLSCALTGNAGPVRRGA